MRTTLTLFLVLTHFGSQQILCFSSQRVSVPRPSSFARKSVASSARVERPHLTSADARRLSQSPLSASSLLSSAGHPNRVSSAYSTSALAFRKTDEDEHRLSTSNRVDPIGNMWLLVPVIPLWLVYISNQVSRSSLYNIVDFSQTADAFSAMNKELNFGETEYGLLASVAFTALFAVASLGAGIAADRFDRKTLTVGSAMAWSVATFGTATSDSYTQVVVWRVLMGLACAFSTPTAYTLIKDQVPPERSSLANSIYGTGVAVASALASLCILLDKEYGWRNTLYIIATFGAVSAAVSATVLAPDPKEPEATDGSDKTLNQLNGLSQVLAIPRVQWIYLASFVRFCAGLSIGVWGAPYFRGAYNGQQGDFAVAQAFISAVGASVSGLLGGSIADSISKDSRDPAGRKLLVPVVGSLLAAPAWYLAVHSGDSFETAMVWLAVEYFVAECWFGPTISAMQASVDDSVGGTAQGLFTLTGAIANLAPSLLGYIYGQSKSSGSESLADVLGLIVCTCYVASSALFYMAAQTKPSTSMKES